MEAKKIGRPTIYTTDIAEEICDGVACSSKGIGLLCKENKHWPCPDTIFRWRKIYKDFSEQYARAKECQVEAIIDDILEIADDTSNVFYFK